MQKPKKLNMFAEINIKNQIEELNPPPPLK